MSADWLTEIEKALTEAEHAHSYWFHIPTEDARVLVDVAQRVQRLRQLYAEDAHDSFDQTDWNMALIDTLRAVAREN